MWEGCPQDKEKAIPQHKFRGRVMVDPKSATEVRPLRGGRQNVLGGRRATGGKKC